MEKHRILLADSNAVVRHAVRRAVEGDDALFICGVSTAGSGLDLDVERLNPELVLLDLSLRDGDGFALITRLRRHYRHLRIMVFSMHSEALFAHRSLRAGADGYLRKGCSEEELLHAIHMVLEGAVYVSEYLQMEILKRMRGQGASDAAFEESVERLSNREVEVFELMMRGMRKRDMARRLGISSKTIESHCAHIRRKLSAH